MPKVNMDSWERISNRFSHTQVINERVPKQKREDRGQSSREIKLGSIRVKRGNIRDKRAITNPI